MGVSQQEWLSDALTVIQPRRGPGSRLSAPDLDGRTDGKGKGTGTPESKVNSLFQANGRRHSRWGTG